MVKSVLQVVNLFKFQLEMLTAVLLILVVVFSVGDMMIMVNAAHPVVPLFKSQQELITHVA